METKLKVKTLYDIQNVISMIKSNKPREDKYTSILINHQNPSGSVQTLKVTANEPDINYHDMLRQGFESLKQKLILVEKSFALILT